jgi:hypothetical protein
VTISSSDASGESMKLSGDEGKGVPLVSGDKDEIVVELPLLRASGLVTRKLDPVNLVPALMAHPGQCSCG